MDYGSEKTETKSSSTLSQGKRMLSEAGQSLSEDATSLASAAKHKAVDALKGTAQSATETISTFADAIRKAGDDLAQHDQSAVGRVVKQAADGLASLSRTVSEKSPEDLLRTVRTFGRNNPVAFMAGAVLVGVAIGRLARSSAHHVSHNNADTASNVAPAYTGGELAFSPETRGAAPTSVGVA